MSDFYLYRVSDLFENPKADGWVFTDSRKNRVLAAVSHERITRNYHGKTVTRYRVLALASLWLALVTAVACIVGAVNDGFVRWLIAAAILVPVCLLTGAVSNRLADPDMYRRNAAGKVVLRIDNDDVATVYGRDRTASRAIDKVLEIARRNPSDAVRREAGKKIDRIIDDACSRREVTTRLCEKEALASLQHL